jgi:hypothetical protein
VLPRFQFGILLRLLDPPRYPLLAAPIEGVVRFLDCLSLLAILAAAVLGVLRLRSARPREIGAALGLYAALVPAMTAKGFWSPVYGYCRPLSPLFVLLLAGAGASRGARVWVVALLVCGPVDVRVCAEMATEAWGVLRWLGYG